MFGLVEFTGQAYARTVEKYKNSAQGDSLSTHGEAASSQAASIAGGAWLKPDLLIPSDRLCRE